MSTPAYSERGVGVHMLYELHERRRSQYLFDYVLKAFRADEDGGDAVEKAVFSTSIEAFVAQKREALEATWLARTGHELKILEEA